MSGSQIGPLDGDDQEPGEEAPASEWPIKGPATPQQAIVAIAFVFFLGVAIGFALARAF